MGNNRAPNPLPRAVVDGAGRVSRG